MIKPSQAGLLVSTSASALVFLAFLMPSMASATLSFDGDSTIARHPLETKALIDPEGVLKELPKRILAATAEGDNKELALLYLAQSNACRVAGDWNCQSDAAQSARLAAETAKLPELQVRGLIAESRGRMPLQDFARSERLLGEAVRLLKLHPNTELSADVNLAYSSLSYTLGKHALAADYAARGIVALGDNPALLIRTRLLRNQSRALAQLGDITQAQVLLKKALVLTEQIQDPKLSAELYIEDARIARLNNDVPTQVENGRKILALSERLKNTQLAGLGHEVLGLAAFNRQDIDTATRELTLAHNAFRELKLERDERRTLRALLQTMLGRNRQRTQVEPLMARLIELESSLESYDRNQATDDFNARLKYVQQDFDVQQLKVVSALAAQRESNLAIRQRFTVVVAALGFLLLLVTGGFYLSQRRFNARLQEANIQLQKSEGRMRSIANNIPALISHLDRDERYLFSNAFSGHVFGIDPQTMIGKTVREIRGEALYQDLGAYIQSALRGESVSFEGRSEVGGKLYFYRTNYMPDRNGEGAIQGFFALTFDITDLKLAEAELERLSLIDSMTDVANRRHFEERLAAALHHNRNGKQAVALLCMDIDNFKAINDGHGHLVGDGVLKAFAERLQSCVRSEDVVARLGGDEFAILIDNPSPDSGEEIAKKLLVLMQKPMHIDGLAIQVSTSIGVAFTQRESSMNALMKMADKALYAAKSAGRNTYQTIMAA